MNKLYILLTTLFGDIEERAVSLQGQAHEDRGAAMVEYGLLVAFIALVALIGVTAFGIRVDALFDKVTF